MLAVHEKYKVEIEILITVLLSTHIHIHLKPVPCTTIFVSVFFHHCSDTVGWVTGGASSP